MKKVVFWMLCASVCFGFLATSCSKDEEENSIDPKNVTKSDSDGHGSAISVIQNQIIGTDWYLEHKTGTDDYNNSIYNFHKIANFNIIT